MDRIQSLSKSVHYSASVESQWRSAHSRLSCVRQNPRFVSPSRNSFKPPGAKKKAALEVYIVEPSGKKTSVSEVLQTDSTDPFIC